VVFVTRIADLFLVLSPSLRAEGEAIQSLITALDCFGGRAASQ
jgi:hypothetical protein